MFIETLEPEGEDGELDLSELQDEGEGIKGEEIDGTDG